MKPRIGEGVLKQFSLRYKFSSLLTRIGLGLIILLLWEIAGRSGVVSPIILCPFTDVIKEGLSNYSRYLEHLRITLIEICLALAFAWGLGLLIGIVMGGIQSLRIIFGPLVSSLYAIPIVVVYPVIAAWFGLGIQSKYIFGGVYGLFPVVLNTVAGIAGVDRSYLVLARSLGATRFQTITRIMVPFSLPEILAGIRLGAALAVIGVVVAEMLASSVGLGYLIEYNRTIFRTANVYFAIIIVLFVVGIIDRILYVLENRLVYWTV